MAQYPAGYPFKECEAGIIRLKCQNEKEFDNWLQEYEKMTMVTWRRTTTKKLADKKPRNLLKRYYHCHFKTRSKAIKDKKPSVRVRSYVSRNKDCQAKMTCTIKKIITKPKKIDPLLPDWPCIVQFRNQHNHNLTSSEILKHRPIGAETKDKIRELFKKGHSASTAYHTYAVSLMEEHGDNYEKIMLDRHFFPSQRDLENLYRDFKGNLSETTSDNINEHLENVLEQIKVQNNTLYKIVQIDEHYAVALCTPIMQRAAILRQSSEIMFVDSSDNYEKKYKVYFFITQSVIGALPLGCILITDQKVFSEAVNALYEILPIKIAPKIILTDDNICERNSLQTHWPNSTFLLCSYHVLKACWKWLRNPKNKVNKDDVQMHYKLFRNILTSTTFESLEMSKEIFYRNNKYINFGGYVDNMLLKVQFWGLYYRQQLPIEDSYHNNNIEIIFRFLKEVLLDRTKAFNLIQMSDFVVNNFESYYKQCILDILFKKISRLLERYYPSKDNDITEHHITRISHSEFEVLNPSNMNIKYAVDMIIFKCTCNIGYRDRPCKHQYAAAKYFNIIIRNENISDIMKTTIYHIATGKQPNNRILNHNEIVKYNDADYEITYFDDEDNESQDNVSAASNYTDNEINTIKRRYEEHSQQILANLDKNPAMFLPALKSYLDNVDQYATTDKKLASGLCAAFKFKTIVRKPNIEMKTIDMK